MHRIAIGFIVLLLFGTTVQTFASQATIIHDPQAISLLQQSLAAMSNGVAVSDVSLTGTATRTAGSDQQSGQVTLEAKGIQESKISLSLSGYSFTEVRNFANGAPSGSYVGTDGVVHTTAQQNCFGDAAWFFPLLSSSALAGGNSGMNLSYIGQETFNGAAVQHVEIWQSASSPDVSAVKAIGHLSTVDLYLDAATTLPIAVRSTTHPADDASKDFAIEIRFSNYQLTNGVLIPFHVQKFLNGGLVLDLTISSAVLNSGIPDTDFILQ